MRTVQTSLSSIPARTLILLGLLAAPACGRAQVQAQQADAFVNSIGVVTHLTYTNSLYYTEWPQIYQSLQTLGVRHIRDGFYNWSSGSPFISEHQQLAQAGIGTDYVVPYNSSTTAQQIEAMSPQVEDMEALEAPNECDVPENCGGTSSTSASQDISNMLSFLPTIDAAGSDLSIPVAGPSFVYPATYSDVGNLSSEMNFNNLHVYFGGRYPGNTGWGAPDAEGNDYGSFPFWLDQANDEGPGAPVWVTETGYITFPSSATTCSENPNTGNMTVGLCPYNIPQTTAASYVPRTLLLAFQDGIQRSYLYELVEDPSSDDYGLLNSDLSPRPAYEAVYNLIANLSDPGPSFTPGQLSYSVNGGGSTPKQVLLQKRDGSFWLILWLEQSSYDEATNQSTPVTPQSVTLTVNGSYQIPNVGQFADTGSLTWSSLPGPSSVSLTISDQLTIVKILPQ
jgi:hypothetical protein